MYVWRNTEARSRNNCREKAVTITYSDCVSVALGIQHTRKAKVKYYIVVCGLSGSTSLLHIISWRAYFGEKVIEYKSFAKFFLKSLSKNISMSENSAIYWMYRGLHVKYRRCS
jgi:hypothetical protein